MLDRFPKGAAVPPTAVLTRSALVRGVVTVFSGLSPRAMRAFSPEDVRTAAQHLRLPDAQMQRLVDVGHALRPG